jgi:hypothetical protein
MPLTFHPQGIQLIVTPLNILSEQNKTILDRLGVKTIFISASTATEHNFHVSFACPALFCMALHLFRILLHFATVLLLSIPRSSFSAGCWSSGSGIRKRVGAYINILTLLRWHNVYIFFKLHHAEPSCDRNHHVTHLLAHVICQSLLEWYAYIKSSSSLHRTGQESA